MEEKCNANISSVVEIRVIDSKCVMMPEGVSVFLEGPRIDYSRSGPVCVTALNAIYPWVMAARFGVKTEVLDYDRENDCYHCVCPCGTVRFDILKLK